MTPKSGQVGVDCFRNRPVCIIGEVANAGCFPYVRGMRLITAIAMAGGFTYRALEDEYVIMRDGK
jgi:polysaccharide export outer membrane protein